jgi:hypothetical protein
MAKNIQEWADYITGQLLISDDDQREWFARQLRLVVDDNNESTMDRLRRLATEGVEQSASEDKKSLYKIASLIDPESSGSCKEKLRVIGEIVTKRIEPKI